MGFDGKSAKVGMGEILHGDCAKILSDVPDKSVSLVITSPPYNIGKPYEKERMTLEEYAEWLRPIVTSLTSKVKPSGSICWQVGNYVKDGVVVPLDYIFYEMFTTAGMKLRNRIIWHFNFGLHAQQRFSGRYETLLWFTKSDSYRFNLDKVRVPQLYPGKRHPKGRANGGGQLSGNPLGKNPSDVWEFSAPEAFLRDALWNIPNVKSLHPEKTAHPCQFPSELVERCVLAFTKPGDTVLDPFVGAGTSVIAAVKLGRRGIGIDKSKRYVNLANKRIAALEAGTLEFRRSGTPIRQPRKGEKVATVPAEWKKRR